MLHFKSLARSLLHLAFPELCAGCHAPLVAGEQLLCLSCQMEAGRTGYHEVDDNNTATRIAGRFPFKHATSFAHFSDGSLIQHLIHLLKYKGRREAGVQLGNLFAEDLLDAGWIKTIDLLVPVPLHPKKERLRGYNQAAAICEGLSQSLRIPHLPHALLRTRHTESQTRKTRAQRADNVAALFVAKDPKLLAGKHVLLVDDVLTTGATIEQAATALLRVPGAQVSIATLAIAD